MPDGSCEMDYLTHEPRFRWYDTGDGQCGIRDGDMPVGRLYTGTEPLGRTARPICLHDLRLIPGGRPFIGPDEGCGALCLSWRKHLIFQPVIDELTVDDEDPRCMKLYVRSHDAGLRADQPVQPAYAPGNVTEETWVELTYDPRLPSYVIEVRTMLRVSPGRTDAMLARDLRGLEFGDILPAGCNGQFPPRGEKRYQWYVYKGRDGRLLKLPHNHSRGPERQDILYAGDGSMAFLTETDFNPIVQFADGTGLSVFSEVCHAMYDIHFKFIREKQISLLEAGEPLEVRYRVYSVCQDEAERMLSQANWDPKLKRSDVRAPLYAEDGVNLFQPSDVHLQPTDRWPWQPGDPCCAWLWDTGHHSNGCLMIRREAQDGTSQWRCERAIEELRRYSLTRPFNGRFRVTAMVRTDKVTGSTRLGWASVGGTPEGWRRTRESERSPVKLRGTNDWTRICLDTQPGSGAVSATVFLEQEGSGQSWFDEVEIRPLV
jgi:hypothetical protein